MISKMATHHKTLHLIASKLGIAKYDKVVSKAAEFERLLQTRSVAGIKMTDTSKIVICLNLAAELLGADLDQKTAIKYSGLKPILYANSKKMIQNLLEFDSGKLTTSVLCAALQCSSVQILADQILEEYQKQAKMEIDLNLPHYVCMAVYQACRISKVKISRSKMTEKARLKQAQWAKLDAEWAKFVDEHFASAKKKPGKPTKKKQENEPEQTDIEPSEKEEAEPEIEPYEDWKRRMLETAHKELRELEKLETKDREVNLGKSPKSKNTPQKISPSKSPGNKEVRILLGASDKLEAKQLEDAASFPRRSPRKTPQKYSPYESPGKIKGVRLLFPTS